MNKRATSFLDTRAVSLLSPPVDGEWGIGSGTCVRIGGRYFIATAAHVIDGLESDDLHLATENARHVTSVKEIDRGSIPTPYDVGYLELDASVAQSLPRDFVTLDQIQPYCADVGDQDTLLYGTPAKLAAEIAPSEVEAQPVGFSTMSPEPTDMPLEADLSMDLFLKYPFDGLSDADGNPVNGIEAVGFSGGGVWGLNINPYATWSPERVRLLAIATDWDDWVWVRCVQIQHWLEMVAADYDDLRDEIRLALDDTQS